MKAIDVHVHVPEEPRPRSEASRARQEQMNRYFRAAPRPQSPEEMYQKFKELDIVACIFSVDSRTISGEEPSSNDYVAGIAQKHPEQFIPFAAVDPWMGKMAVKEMERCVKELGMKGLKLHPGSQEFYANDRRFYPLWEKCAELGVPVLFHTGHMGAGSGVPGGMGLKLKYCAPIPYLDDIAADFPELTIISAHPGWPWQDEQLSVAVHKGNFYIDISGWSPKYFQPILVQYMNSRIPDKVLFGSDYPVVQPDRWLRDFEALGIKEEVVPKILYENARKVLKLDKK